MSNKFIRLLSFINCLNCFGLIMSLHHHLKSSICGQFSQLMSMISECLLHSVEKMKIKGKRQIDWPFLNYCLTEPFTSKIYSLTFEIKIKEKGSDKIRYMWVVPIHWDNISQTKMISWINKLFRILFGFNFGFGL